MDMRVPEDSSVASAEAVAAYRDFVEAVSVPGKGHATAYMRFFSPNTLINVVHPFGLFQGVDGFLSAVLAPMQRSFETLHRRDQIIMSGRFNGEDWVSATGYLVGNHVRDWLGIECDGEMAFIRFGEFHRIEAERAVESYIFFDLPELMITRGQWPFPGGPGLLRGYTGRVPGPAIGDGRVLEPQLPEESAVTLRMVTDMIRGYGTQDEAWRHYWREDMSWYGPAAFGSFLGLDGFASFQIPFESSFENLSGGIDDQTHTSHVARFGSGSYACLAGWPSMSGVLTAPLLDFPPTGRRVYLRVASWWRRDDRMLAENWVIIDVPDLIRQMGYDVFGKLSRP